MNVLHKAVACALLIGIYTAAAVVATSSKEIEGIPSNFNYIIHEEYNSNLSSDQIISVSTNVPLTIQRYSDNYFRSGEAPFDSGDAAVLITSNCDATTYIPEVEWSDENDSITVLVVSPSSSLSSDETSLNDMPFIDSSSYVVKWEYDPCSTAGGQSAEATELVSMKVMPFQSCLLSEHCCNVVSVGGRKKKQQKTENYNNYPL